MTPFGPASRGAQRRSNPETSPRIRSGGYDRNFQIAVAEAGAPSSVTFSTIKKIHSVMRKRRSRKRSGAIALFIGRTIG
jgi:hypothetical protein